MKDLSGKCLIEICGDACVGCLAVLPNCKQVAQRFGLRFVGLNVEDDEEQVKSFNVERIPTIILWNDGKEIARCHGYQPQEILELWMEAKLS